MRRDAYFYWFRKPEVKGVRLGATACRIPPIVPYIVELPQSSSSDRSSSDEDLVAMHDDELPVPELDQEEAVIRRLK
jgi:hypothetical protein